MPLERSLLFADPWLHTEAVLHQKGFDQGSWSTIPLYHLTVLVSELKYYCN